MHTWKRNGPSLSCLQLRAQSLKGEMDTCKKKKIVTHKGYKSKVQCWAKKRGPLCLAGPAAAVRVAEDSNWSLYWWAWASKKKNSEFLHFPEQISIRNKEKFFKCVRKMADEQYPEGIGWWNGLSVVIGSQGCSTKWRAQQTPAWKAG